MFMQKLRSNVGKVILWLVILAFVGWIIFDLGADLVGKRMAKPWEQGIIAEVEDKPISYEEYRARLDVALRDTVQARQGRQVSPEEEARIAEAVWQEMIDDVRWAKVLKDRGLELEDEAVIKLLTQFPPPEVRSDSNFWTQGQFNYQLYLQALSDPRNTPYFAQYERQLRRDIPRDFMRFDLATSVSFSEAEVFADYQWKSTRANLAYVSVNANVAVPNDQVNVSEDEMRSYYDQHKEDYKVGERASLYVLRIPKLPSAQDSADAKEQLMIALEEINQGTSFEEAVGYYSEDPKAQENAGDMGWVKLEFLPKTVRDALANAQVGSIVGPVLSPKGYHLFKVEEIEGDSMHLRQIVVQVHTSNETLQQLSDQIKEVLDSAKTSDLAQAAQAFGLKVDTVQNFELDKGFIPMIGPEAEVIQMIQDNKPGFISPMIRKPGFYAAFQLTDKQPAGVMSFEEARDRIEADLRLEKKKAVARQMVNRALDAIRSGQQPTIEQGLFYRQDSTASYSTYLPGVPDKEMFWGAVWGAKQGQVVGPFESKSFVYGVKVISKQVPTKEDFALQKQMILQQEQSTWVQRLMSAWQDELNKDLRVKDYRPYVFMY